MKLLRETFLYDLKKFFEDFDHSNFDFESSFKFCKFLIMFFSKYNERLIEEEKEIEVSSKYGHWESILTSYKSIPLDEYLNLVQDSFKLFSEELKNSTNRRNSETHEETPENPQEESKAKQIAKQLQ